jgi:hypothetical protein
MNRDMDAQLDSIDRTRLEPIVRCALDNKEAKVLDWKIHPLSSVTASVGYIFRLTGTARTQSDVLDWSAILKVIPSPTSNLVKLNFLSDEPSHFGYWRREMLLYQSGLCDELPDGLVAPRCYAVSEHVDSYWLWLEDLADGSGTQWSLSHIGLAARRFGHFNGLYAVERPLPSWPWLASDEGVSKWIIEQRLVTDETWQQISDQCKKHALIRHAWPDDTLEKLQHLWREREEFYSILKQLPITLIHGDVSCKNLFARRRENGDDEIVAIDWGLVGIAPLGQEISDLTVHTVRELYLPPGKLDELDQHVFDEYIQGLRDVGWKGDSRVVRLGCTARTALHFGLGLTMMRGEMSFLDDEKRVQIEANTGLSMEEHLDIFATLRRFVTAQADETRALKNSLHL